MADPDCFLCNDNDFGRKMDPAQVAEFLEWITDHQPRRVTMTGDGGDHVVFRTTDPAAERVFAHGSYHAMWYALTSTGLYNSVGVIHVTYHNGARHAKNVRHTGVGLFTRQAQSRAESDEELVRSKL
jgi:hypothetical protein